VKEIELYLMARSVTIILLLCGALFGASDEDLLTKSRRLATTGHRAEALEALRSGLAERPSDLDCRTLYGTIFSWEARYDEAREALELVLAASPGYYDALLALIRVELWADRPVRAEQLVREGLLKNPNDSSLVLLRVRALQAQQRTGDAAEILRKAMEADPRNAEFRSLLESSEEEGRQWDVSTGHTQEWFNDGRASWREEQLSLRRLTPAGSVIGRLSFANRFETGSRQAEVDFYPRIRRGTYGYVNLGWSPDAALYPRYRFGADLYQSLGHGWEGTAGYRRLGFGGQVNIYTAAVTRYYGDWMITARTFLTPDSAGTSRSISVLARRYFRDGTSYVGLRWGRGASPTETRSLQDIEILNSTSIAVQFRRNLNRHIVLECAAGTSGEDRLLRAGLRSYLLDTSFHYRF
jgi:YaiO family outer membrane protein